MFSKSLAFASVLALANAQALTEVIANTSDLSTLNSLLTTQPDLLTQLGSASNITILAPSNDALGALINSSAGQGLSSNPGLLTAILQYHVLQGTYQASAIPENLAFVPSLLNNTQYANVSGGQVVGVERADSNVTIFSGLLQNSSVVTPNVNFTGGVVHVIDTVLTLPESASDTLVAAGLSSLAGALTNASLVDTVNGLQNVTIFAPNNAAFRNIGSALPSLTPENVTNILTYHVVQGMAPLYSSVLTDGVNVTTLQGTNITVSINDDRVFVNDARVVIPNVLIAGGVVHVIDQVLNPGNTTTAGDDDQAGEPAFEGATPGTEDPFTSGVPAPSTTVGGSTPTGSPGSQASSSSTAGAMPMITGAVGAAALFGAGAAMLNY